VKVFASPRATVVVRGAEPPPEALLSRVPEEPGVHLVVVAATPPPSLDELTDVLRTRLPVDSTAVRLVLSHAAGNASALADRLRVTVYAPDGPVSLLGGGVLFVSGGQWTKTRPGRRPVPRGARFPAPLWQGSSAGPPPAKDGLAFSVVPAGLWLHPGEVDELPMPLLGTPIDFARPAIFVGHPHRPAFESGAFESIAALPRLMRRRLLLIPYGPDSMLVHDLAEHLAMRAGAEVEVLSGVPDTDERGLPVLTAVDRDGRRSWRPDGEAFLYRGAAVPELIRGRAMLTGAPMRAAWQAVSNGWGVETIRAGWLLRREAGDPDAGPARRIRPQSAFPMIVLGAEAMDEGESAAHAVAALPDRVRATMRLAVTRVPPGAVADSWRSLSPIGEVFGVIGDGTLVALPGTGSVAAAASAADASPPRPFAAAAARPSTLAFEPTVAMRRPPPDAAPPGPSPAAGAIPLDPTVALQHAESIVQAESAAPLSRADSVRLRRPGQETPRGPFPVEIVPRRQPMPGVRMLVASPDLPTTGTESAAVADEISARHRDRAEALLARMPAIALEEHSVALDELAALATFVDLDPDKLDPAVTAAAARGLVRLPARPGAILAPWRLADGKPGTVYASAGMLGGGLADGGTPVGVWTTSARPLPAELGAPAGSVLIPPRTRFVVLQFGPVPVLLHEVTTGWVSECGREAARRAVAAWQRAPQSVSPGREGPASR